MCLTALVHLYIQESGITNSHFHDENLIATVVNLFAAGTDTTATTLRWALLLMAKYPKTQGQELKTSAAFIQQQPVQAITSGLSSTANRILFKQQQDK